MIYSEKHFLSNDMEWIVFVHGAGGNSSTWKFQIPYFKEHYNLLLFDLRGHGKSTSQNEENPYSFDSVANDLLEVMNENNVPKAHLMGLSIGSLIIHKFYELAPDRVLSIIGTGGIYKISWQIHYFSRFAHSLAKVFPYHFLYVLFAYIVMPKRNHAVSRKIFIKASKKLVRREYIRWLNLYGTFRETVEKLDFDQQNIPILIVMGEEDHLFLKPAKDFCGLNNRGRLQIMKGCGHICNIEKPELYNGLVHEFLIDKSKL